MRSTAVCAEDAMTDVESLRSRRSTVAAGCWWTRRARGHTPVSAEHRCPHPRGCTHTARRCDLRRVVNHPRLNSAASAWVSTSRAGVWSHRMPLITSRCTEPPKHGRSTHPKEKGHRIPRRTRPRGGGRRLDKSLMKPYGHAPSARCAITPTPSAAPPLLAPRGVRSLAATAARRAARRALIAGLAALAALPSPLSSAEALAAHCFSRRSPRL
mmetsp:Transcript_22535/g.60964  ORF Transcript_22535/g.60964 Transcript_22535/m.60964 type:complete len:213 (+) Transcript_22535:133-771(+)